MQGAACKIRYSASDLGFTLPTTGARLRFVTRSRQASRGAAGDLIVFDEAGWLDEATHNALLPTLSARSASGKVQVYYAGTAVDQLRHPDGVVLSRASAGAGSRATTRGSRSWSGSAEVLDEDGNELPPDLVPDAVAADPEVQRACNPAIPARIAASHVDWEYRALDRRGFATNGWGSVTGPPRTASTRGRSTSSCGSRWRIRSRGSRGRSWSASTSARTRQSSIAVAGLRDDGLVHVEISDHRLTTRELVDRIEQLVERP